jgi:hypothetical protein
MLRAAQLSLQGRSAHLTLSRFSIEVVPDLGQELANPQQEHQAKDHPRHNEPLKDHHRRFPFFAALSCRGMIRPQRASINDDGPNPCEQRTAGHPPDTQTQREQPQTQQPLRERGSNVDAGHRRRGVSEHGIEPHRKSRNRLAEWSAGGCTLCRGDVPFLVNDQRRDLPQNVKVSPPRPNAFQNEKTFDLVSVRK